MYLDDDELTALDGPVEPKYRTSQMSETTVLTELARLSCTMTPLQAAQRLFLSE